MKIFIAITLLTLAALAQAQVPGDFPINFSDDLQDDMASSNGTESFFFSHHGLGRTPEVEVALSKIVGQVKVHRTTHNVSSINYIIDNVTLGIVYNQAKQEVIIPKNDIMQIQGGKFEFTYRFNYTKIENRNNITGYAYGSVYSDNLTYSKEFGFYGGFLCFRIPPTEGIHPVSITNNMTIKRMEPYNQTDLQNLQNMLGTTTEAIEPSNIRHQIEPAFNQLFPQALNDSLNGQHFGQNVDYSWQSSTHGNMTMKIIHQIHGFGINPVTGLRLIFVALIDGWTEQICPDINVPLTPASYQIYGGSQSYHLNCLYQSVVFYLQSNGWLDVSLNSQWEVNAFQFYAGDLFDLINNLHLDFSARAILDGRCEAQREGLKFSSSREFDSNSYALLTAFKCSLKGTNSQGTTQEVMKFTLNTRLYIVAAATTKSLSFKITYADVDDISFQPVGSYHVINTDLASYRAKQVLKSVENTETFGTNFPTVQRDVPHTRVDHNQVFYYDNSHIDLADQ